MLPTTYEPPKWDEHKELIADLYDKKELKEVIRMMKDCYSFKASCVCLRLLAKA
jgi:hypothetical protein